MELQMGKMTYLDRLQFKAKQEGILEGKIEDARLMKEGIPYF